MTAEHLPMFFYNKKAARDRSKSLEPHYADVRVREWEKSKTGNVYVIVTERGMLLKDGTVDYLINRHNPRSEAYRALRIDPEEK